MRAQTFYTKIIISVEHKRGRLFSSCKLHDCKVPHQYQKRTLTSRRAIDGSPARRAQAPHIGEEIALLLAPSPQPKPTAGRSTPLQVTRS